jgi:hypothetical protein
MNTYTTPVLQIADRACRIEKRRDAHGFWHQRHIWSDTAEEWIATKNRDENPGPTFSLMGAAQ